MNFLSITTLMLSTQPIVGMGDITNTAKTISDLGITLVLCALMIVFIVVMFNTIIRRTTKDEVIVKLLTDLTSTVNTIKNSDIDVAGSFDKHNTKFILEVDHIKTAINSVDAKLTDIDHDGIDGIRKILTVIDQECSEIKDLVIRTDMNTKEIKEMLNRLQREIEIKK